MSLVYVIGSLRNPYIPEVAHALRQKEGREVFDNWYAAGPDADDHWRDYHRTRGHGLVDALGSPEARNAYDLDRRWLNRCQAAVLVLPAGRSGHLELGYVVGQMKPGFILLDGEPDRYDLMYNFATQVVRNLKELEHALEGFDL